MLIPKIKAIWKKYDELFFVFLILAGIVLYVKSKTARTEKDGVVTVAKVTGYEGAESGSELYLDIYFEGKIYHTSGSLDCQHDCIGKYFFIRVMKNDPPRYSIFYGYNEVPDCIIKKEHYFKGWKDIPTCENF